MFNQTVVPVQQQQQQQPQGCPVADELRKQQQRAQQGDL
jgi:hypothetical protein